MAPVLARLSGLAHWITYNNWPTAMPHPSSSSSRQASGQTADGYRVNKSARERRIQVHDLNILECAYPGILGGIAEGSTGSEFRLRCHPIEPTSLITVRGFGQFIPSKPPCWRIAASSWFSM
jgi:hypothetical protein